MADEVIAIKIIPEGSVSSGNKKSDSSNSVMGMGFLAEMGGMLEGVIKGIGIGSLVGIAIAVASHFKSLISIVSSIIKMISYLLKPIADVVMILLYPILLMLKPIVLMVNQIMAPFIKQAMLVMKEGATQISSGNTSLGMAAMAGGVSIIASGLSVVIFALLDNIIKGTINSIIQMASLLLQVIVGSLIELVRPILEAFGVNVDVLKTGIMNGINSATTWITDQVSIVIDSVFGTLSAAAYSNATFISEKFGVNTDEFQIKANQTLKNIFIDAPDSLNNTWSNMMSTNQGFGFVANQAIQKMVTGPDGISTNFGDQMDTFKKHGKEKISSAVSAFNDEFDKMKKARRNAEESFAQNVADSLLIANRMPITEIDGV